MLRIKLSKLAAKSKSQTNPKAKFKRKPKSQTKTKGKSEAKYHVGSGSGRGQNPAQPAKLRREVRDDGDEIRTLGSKAGKPKVYGDRAHMFGSYLSPEELMAQIDALEKKKEQKAVEDSPNELQLNDEEEEEEEEEEGFELCGICSKEDDHWTPHCPWLDSVPKGSTVGYGYGVVCKDCDVLMDGHPDRNCTGRAVITLCAICQDVGHHWTKDCPKRPKDFKPYVPRHKVLMDEVEYVDKFDD